MMNPIIIPGVAAVALAASALLAPAADAQRQPNICPITGQVLHGGPDSSGYGYSGSSYGYRKQGDRWERRRAVRQCAVAIQRKGYRLGFRDVDFDDRYVKQVGPNGYVVFFETEFEGRRREFERRVRCEVRQGNIVAIDAIPVPGRRPGWVYSSSYGKRGW